MTFKSDDEVPHKHHEKANEHLTILSENETQEVGNAPRRASQPTQNAEPFLHHRSAARKAEARESHAPLGIIPGRPGSLPPPRRRGRSIPTTRHDRADQGSRGHPPTTRQGTDQVSTSDAEQPEPSGWDLVTALANEEAQQQQQAPPIHQGLRSRGDQPYHAPSTSNRRVTGRVQQEWLRELGLEGGTAFQTLMLDRSLGNREVRGRLLHVELDDMRARSETRLLGRRSKSRWDNLSSTFKNFVIWVAEELRGPDLEGINVAWKIVWWVEAKLHAKHVDYPTARKYVKNLVQTSQESGLGVETDVTAAYKASLARDGALRSGSQAPPANKEDVTKSGSLLTPTEYLGMRLSWKTASRIGEIQYLMKEHFANMGGRLWAITFPYHKGDPFRLGTCITVELDESTHRDLVERLKWVPSGVSVTDLTTKRAAAVLNAVRPGLSAHSIKRGALVAMLHAGVPLQLIQIVAKHKDMETLMIYLPRAEVAMSMGLHHATACL